MSPNSPAVALSVSGLVKKYGDFEVIHGLDLQIDCGAIHGLVGLNGSGKTTSLECILGLQAFNAGQISILGHAPNRLHQARGNVVAIFDTPSLYPNLTVRQCLEHASLLCQHQQRSPQQLEQLLGIERFSNFKIKHLSLGNKRRASIAQALVGKPELIILDEPFNGLDAEGVDDVLQLISQINREEGTAFLLSSHQLPYLEQICSHIAILHRGNIVLNDEIGNLLSHTTTTVLIKTQQIAQATTLIDQQAGAAVSKQDADGYLQVDLGELDSAALNQLLVGNGIEVSELILKRASLASLFRAITSEGES